MATGSGQPSQEDVQGLQPDRDADPGAPWGFSGWAQDGKETHCPRCRAEFTLTFRRHHCKQCGELVCDDCSRNWLRLPRMPTAGKVRVCNPCASAIGDEQATGFEEDMTVNAEIIRHIKTALKKMHEQTDAHKVTMLELDAEATGDRSLLEEYVQDPEADAHSFYRLQDRIQQQWAMMQLTLEQQSRAQLNARKSIELERAYLGDMAAVEKDLLVKKAALDEKLVLMDRALAERDGLVRRDAELESAVAAARREVQELEMQRRDREQAGAARPSGLGDRGGSLITASSARSAASSFTISTGRQAPLEAVPNDRLEGCRRQCITM